MVNNIPIYNSGGDTLVISEMNIKGINANEFSVNEILPKKIAPFYTKTIAIEFKPNSLGTKSADLEIKSNSDPNILITIPITAKKDSMNLSFIENTIDLGLLCPGETKDTVIHIMNLGNINTGGHLTNSTNITLGKNEITILPSNTGNIAFQFNGLNAEGIINENITLTDSICGISKTITITGIIQTPKLESGGLVITCIQLTSNDGILTLENKSDRSVLIQNAPIITAPFSLVSNPFPLTIPAHGTKDITLRYSPTDYISHSSAIKFYAEPCDITYETTITGKVSIPTAEIKIDTLSAYPGDILYIPIILNSESNLDLAGESSFSSDLIFNPTLLTPQDQTLNQLQLVDYTHAKIQIKDIPLNSKIGEVLVKIPFVVGLGNAEDCELILQNGKTDNGKAGINSKNGLFKLLGICREGGTRLINPTGKAEISSIIPNPASDDIEININLIEEGNTTLSIYNTNGTKFNEFYISGKTGLRTIKLNAKEFSNGLYYIQLQTPTVVESKKLMIIK